MKPRRHGHVVSSGTKDPLAFAVIRVFIPGIEQEIVKRITDAYGRYFCLVPYGEYYVTIDKKNDDESYTRIFKSGIIQAKNGIIHKDFNV